MDFHDNFEEETMATIKPNTGVGTASLASSLITPGYPMAAAPMASPHATAEAAAGKTDGQAHTLRDKILHQAGHDSNRSV